MTDLVLEPLRDLIPYISSPSQETRVPITLHRLLVYLPLPLLLYTYQCYAVQKPGTRWIRLPIGLFVGPWLWLMAFAVRWGPPGILLLHVTATMSNLVMANRALEFAFASEPVVYIGPATAPPTSSALLNGLISSFSLQFAMRGVNWTFGTGNGLKLPPPEPVKSRRSWLTYVFFRGIIVNLLLVDFILNRLVHMEFMHKIHDGAHVNDVSWSNRLLLTASVPFLADASLSAAYYIPSFVAVITGFCTPQDCPPLFNSPILADSLHDFWAGRWHQVLRRTFMVTSGYPLGALFGRAGLVFGVFASSGFFHSVMLMGNGAPHFDWATFNFFAAQALGLYLEQAVSKTTGKRVEGLLGRLWTYAFIIATSGDACTRWVQLALNNLWLFPLRYSPTERLCGLLGF